MVTLQDCINRVGAISTRIVEEREASFKAFFEKETELEKITQIVLIGSGTSFTSCVTARGFMEKVSGIEVKCVLPNEFLYNCSVHNPSALYLFISQSGTSILTQQCALKVKDYHTASLTQYTDDNELAKMVGSAIPFNCGPEEYGFRTIGYCATILNLMLLGLEIGHRTGRVCDCGYNKYIEQALKIETNHRAISDAANAWFDKNKEQLLLSDSFTLYGNGALYGVALEGALKILEVSKNKMAVGYELDDGMHGPTMGFTNKNCVIVLNDGGHQSQIATNLVNWAKGEKHNGFVFGKDTVDETDFAFDTVSEEFKAIEYAPAVEVLAYRLAVDYGIDLNDKSRHHEKKYFSTHGKI